MEYLTSPISLLSVKVKWQNTTKLLWPFLTFLTASWTLFVSLLLLPIHLFFCGRTLKARWKNSNAFIKTIREQERQSKEGVLYTVPQSSSLRFSIYPGSMCNSVYVYGRMGTCKAQALQRTPPCMSVVLASVGVLIKGLSSLCLPGSSSLTRGLGHQRGAAQRGWRRVIAA